MSASTFFIFLDSRNKINGNNTDFRLSMNDFNIQSGTNVSVSVDELNFYNLQYPINSNNNTITFKENSDDVTIYTATISEGNYTSDSMITELAAQLTSAGGNTYTVTYNESTGKLTVSASIPDTLKFVSINEVFGFSDGSSFSTSTIGNYPVNLAGVEYVDLALPSLISLNMTSNNNTNGILKRIPVDIGWGSMVTYKSAMIDDSVVVNHEYLNNITVRLFNPDHTYYSLPDNAYLSVVLKCKMNY